MANGSAAARFAKAVQHKLDGEYDEAETLFQSILAEEPNNADAYHELGLVYSFRVHDDTIPTLEKAVRLAPTQTKYMISLGKSYAMYGEDDKAKGVFNYVLKVEPNNKDAKQQLDYLSSFG